MITIDGYAIDASLSETHTREADLTDYETEDGADVTDHQRNHPKEVEITGVVSDTPLGPMVDIRNRTTAASDGGDLEFLPSDEALAKLEKLFDNREPVTIETALKIYDSMSLVHLEVPKNPDTGEALAFTATFRELRIVKNNRTVVRVSSPNGARQGHQGTQNVLDGPDAGKTFLDKNGKPYKYVKWNPEFNRYDVGNSPTDITNGIFVINTDAGGHPIGGNTTFWDDASSQFLNSDGSSVTQEQKAHAFDSTGLPTPSWYYWNDPGYAW